MGILLGGVMGMFQVQLTYEQETELKESMMAIAEDNEKHQRSALYYLTSGALCCYNIIQMSQWILDNKKFDKNHNCFCGLNVYFGHINKIRNNKNWLPEKEKEVLELYDLAHRAYKLFDKFSDEKFEHVERHMQVQQHLLNRYETLIEYVLEKENLRDVFSRSSKENHDAVLREIMDLGKYSYDVVEFFLDYFIYKDTCKEIYKDY